MISQTVEPLGKQVSILRGPATVTRLARSQITNSTEYASTMNGLVLSFAVYLLHKGILSLRVKDAFVLF